MACSCWLAYAYRSNAVRRGHGVHMSDDMLTDGQKARFTLALVEQCVRNTALEDLHAGTVPSSATGDLVT